MYLIDIPDTPPSHLLPWLRYQHSITEKLKEKTPNVRMQILRHAWAVQEPWDRLHLQIVDEQVLHREIIMYADNFPCWLARTVIPESTFLQDKRFFERLTHEPLGALLFEPNARLKRKNITIYPIYSQSQEMEWVVDCLKKCHIPQELPTLWMRISVFCLGGVNDYPVYLLEVFLPDLKKYSP